MTADRAEIAEHYMKSIHEEYERYNSVATVAVCACGRTFAAINPGSARAYLSLHVEKETGVASDWNG